MLREALTTERLRSMAPGEVSAYFVSRQAEGLSATEQEMLADWLAADQAHAQALDRATQAWNSFGDADGDEILAAMRAHAQQSRSNGWRHWPRAVAAAAVAILVTAGILFVSPLRQGPVGQGVGSGEQVAWSHFASGHGQVREIKLPDGTAMTLDTDSVVQARFLRGARAVNLVRGRVFFDVAKDPARPFAVAAADRSVVVVGTRFEVDTNDGGLRVSLFRGRVTVHPRGADGQVATLDPGQQFVERDGTAKVGPIGNDGAEPAWLGGLIELDDTPLADAIRQINRYSRAQISIAGAGAATIRVSGQFKTGDAARFASTISEAYPVRIIRRGDAIEMVGTK